MPFSADLQTQEPAIAQPLCALHAVGKLLACADQARWASLGKPAAAELGALLLLVHSELDEAIADTLEQKQLART